MVLDLYAAVIFDDARRRVTVQAGCRFGADPHDRTGRASLAAGLCAQLEARGWALPNLAGVTHMTVAGLLATGAGGGSVRHGLHDAVVALRLVDGTGAVHALSAGDDPARFLAAGVAMGLLGVVSTITLQCVPRFDVIGSESTSTVARAPFDLCGSGAGSLEAFLRDTEYARVLWWPQRGVDKLVVWQARRMARPTTGTRRERRGHCALAPTAPSTPCSGARCRCRPWPVRRCPCSAAGAARSRRWPARSSAAR